MKMFRRWAWISMMLSGCCVALPKEKNLEPVIQPAIENEVVLETAVPVQTEEKVLGWLEISGVLSQGFVQGKDNQQYLYVNVDGTPSLAGANFLDYRCQSGSDNLIIYGHSSRTSQILFTPLVQYLDEDFAFAHQEMELMFANELRTYHIISVFLFDVNEPSDNDWMQIDFKKNFLFEKAVERLCKRSLFTFESQKGDQLLTLVTCNPDNHNERLIVVGMKKS